MQHTILEGILILLTCAVMITTLFRRLHLSPVLGYLAVGMLTGPFGFALINNPDYSHNLAEFGVVFLMFTIGLEFSLAKLIAMRRIVLGLGGLQVAITTLIAMGVALLLGENVAGALVIGGVITMSSTAICIKTLTDQLEINTPHGNNAVGILLFQDIAVIPFLILVPSLGAGGDSAAVLMPLVIAFIKASLVMVFILIAGRWLLRPLFIEIAATRSLELFTLTILLVTLGAAWLTESMGLSLALGAFLAGMMLGETKFRHQIEIEIRPFRDVLLGLFFITVGMMLNVQTLPSLWLEVLGLFFIIIVLKTVIIALLSLLFKADKATALRTGLVLAQGGEFGFALLTIAIASEVLSPEQTQAVLGALIFSMAASPLLIRYNEQISRWLLPTASKICQETQTQDIENEAKGLSKHVIICGYGRVGQNITRFLETEGFEYIALDLDPLRVQSAQLAGERVSYGDSSHLGILKAAGLERAHALIISFEDIHATMKILPQVREELPNLPILVRTRDDAQLKHLQQLGATEVVPETLEASLMLAFHVLVLMGVPASRAMHRIRGIRKNRYNLLQQVFPSHELEDLESDESFKEHLHVVNLHDNAYAIGKKLGEFHLETKDITVTAVRRGCIRGPEPEPDTQLRAGDVLVLYGSPANLEASERLLLDGGDTAES
ncbi:MAG: potassium transporter [Legionellales bacterium]|nr:potassium transporter [Legionellales bacterium]|tara:strand:+ start:13207 stop:15207 length:2001 start_codon:yes stop_codon:yes gene_type:complete